MRRAAFAVVLAGMAVTAPRLMLAYLKGDGLALSAQAEFYVFGITGIASGIVLTLGNAFIASKLASRHQSRSVLWWLVALGWLAFLGFAVILAAPVLMQGLQHSDLSEVLTTPRSQWVWAIVAVLSIEVLIAISMAAHVMDAEPAVRPKRQGTQPGTVGLLAAALAKRIEAGIDQPAFVAKTGVASAGTHTETAGAQADASDSKKRKRCPNWRLGCGYVGTTYGLNAHKRFCQYEQKQRQIASR